MWITSAAQARTVDQKASEVFGIPSSVLMERAGAAVFQAVCDLLPDGGSVSIFCGKGNNGGDGLVVARHAHLSGYRVDCLVAALEKELTPEATDQLWALREAGLQPIFYDDMRWVTKADCVGCRDLVVDALLGIGAHAEVSGPVREAIQSINRSGVPVVSVDVPTGIHCDSGEELGESVWALRTVTIGSPKPYLFQGLGLEHAGYWNVAEIGYPTALLQEPTGMRLVENEWVANLLPERLRASHKGENGHILIVAGSDRMAGAALLAARAALRSGAGLVTVASTPRVCQAVNLSLPEALTLPLPDYKGVLIADGAQELISYSSRCHSALFGPGLTHEVSVLEFLSRVWAEWSLPSVIDADALNAVSHGVPLPPTDCVLTPHPGELSRLLHSSIAEIQSDRFRAITQAVQQYRHTVLLKGPYSITGDPHEPLMVNSTGNPGMASGGMGDVLSGVTATLLAQELPPYYAVACGAYWHGLAGDLCAQEMGPIGFTATDVSNMLPKARVRIVESCAHNLLS